MTEKSLTTDLDTIRYSRISVGKDTSVSEGLGYGVDIKLVADDTLVSGIHLWLVYYQRTLWLAMSRYYQSQRHLCRFCAEPVSKSRMRL